MLLAEALDQAGGSRVARLLSEPPDELDALVERTLEWLAQGQGRQIVTLGDPLYPTPLLETADPPLMRCFPTSIKPARSES